MKDQKVTLLHYAVIIGALDKEIAAVQHLLATRPDDAVAEDARDFLAENLEHLFSALTVMIGSLTPELVEQFRKSYPYLQHRVPPASFMDSLDESSEPVDSLMKSVATEYMSHELNSEL